MKTAVDYSFDLDQGGYCCYPPDHESYSEDLESTLSSYNDCITAGGFFLFDQGTCPDLGVEACCCACKHVAEAGELQEFLDNPGPDYGDGCPNGNNSECYQGGLKETTFCECNDIGGIWAGTYSDGTGVSCSLYENASHLLCDPDGPDPQKDVRFPGCCTFTNVDTNTECVDVCSAQACLDYVNSVGGDTEGEIIYTPGSPCDDIDCANQMNYGGSEENRSRENRDARTGILFGNKMSYTEKNPRSFCVYKDADSNVKCSKETKDSCESKNGIYGGFDSNSLPLNCDSTRATNIINYFENDKEKISSSIKNTWSLGDKVLNAGVYIGDFSVQSPNSSEGSICYGNPDTGDASLYVATDNNKVSDVKYAIILYPKDLKGYYDNKLLLQNLLKGNATTLILNPKNSSWNSIENDQVNKNMKLTKTVNNLGDHKWINPSIDVFSFIHNQMKENKTEIMKNIGNSENPEIPYSGISPNEYYGTSTLINDGKNPPRTYTYAHDGNFVSLFRVSEKLTWRPILMLEIV